MSAPKEVVQGQLVQGQVVQAQIVPPQQQQYAASANTYAQPTYVQPTYTQPVTVQPNNYAPHQQIQQHESVSNGRVVVTQLTGFEYSHANAWRGGIYDCCAIACVPSCVMAYCCPCIPLGQLSQKVNWWSYHVVVGMYIALWVLVLVISSLFDSDITFLVLLFVFFVCMTVRQRVRSRLNIPGDGCDDCACSFFCTCCTIAQMTRTVFNYQDGDSCSQCGERGEPQWWLNAEANRLNQEGQQQPHLYVVAGSPAATATSWQASPQSSEPPPPPPPHFVFGQGAQYAVTATAVPPAYYEPVKQV